MLGYLTKTAQNLASIFRDKNNKIDKDTLEELLIEADIDYDVVELLLEALPKVPSPKQLEAQMLAIFSALDSSDSKDSSTRTPRDSSSLESNTLESSSLESAQNHIDLIIGVNGAGKTTTIAKLANLYKQQGHSVLLGAADTFRAAAIEQLKLWAQKLQIPIIHSQQGGDPSAIAFDTIESGLAKGVNRIIIDTAGRLHNQTNLQKELEKIDRVCAKAAKEVCVRKILILDGTQGSSALNQATIFSQSIDIQGIIVTKLDGTSKGGVILSIAHKLQIPILFLGIGEKESDLIPFDTHTYIQGLLDCFFPHRSE